MPLTTVPLPYGLRNVKVRPLTGEVPAATGINFPNSRTFGFVENEAVVELRGDDGLVAIHGNGATVKWTLDGGGYSFDAVKAMYGGTLVDTGITPNQKRTFTKADTDARPYFEVEGQAISDSGGDFHIKLLRAKATGDLTGTLADGTFWLTNSSGQGLARASDRQVYSIVQNETTTALT